MALNARTLAVRPAVDRRWADALAAFGATRELGALGRDTRGDTVEGLSALLRQHDVDPQAWYGVWLFADWLDLPPVSTDVVAVAAVEFAASLRNPYRQLSRVFQLIGRRTPAPGPRAGRAVAAPGPYCTESPSRPWLIRPRGVAGTAQVRGLSMSNPGDVQGAPSAARYSDVAYLTFTAGLTFQVSDPDVPARDIRRAVLPPTRLS